MRILVVGASGVLGQATVPDLHQAGHLIFGTTRTATKSLSIVATGAEPVVCDVYDEGALDRLARSLAPEIVVNFLTDLASGPGLANSRIRSEGGPIVTAAARACGARRLVVESIAFETSPTSTAAVAALEGDAIASGLETLVLRFGRFWGPGTWDAHAPPAPAIHVADAGRRAAELILRGHPGIHVVASPDGTGAPRGATDVG